MPPSLIKILTLNVRGLNNPVKRKAILSYLESTKADICLLQETHLLTKDCHRFRSCTFPQQFFSSSSTKTAGVAILISRNFRGRVIQKGAEIKGRLLTYHLNIEGHTLTVGTLYAPNEGQETFLHEALTEASATQD